MNRTFFSVAQTLLGYVAASCKGKTRRTIKEIEKTGRSSLFNGVSSIGQKNTLIKKIQ